MAKAKTKTNDLKVKIHIEDIAYMSTETLSSVLRDTTKRMRELQIQEFEIALQVLLSKNKGIHQDVKDRLLIDFDTFKRQIRGQILQATRFSDVKKGSVVFELTATVAAIYYLNKILGDPLGDSVKKTKSYGKWVSKLSKILDHEIRFKRIDKAEKKLDQHEALGSLPKEEIVVDDESGSITVVLNATDDPKRETTPLHSEVD
jgi:hypothetical protein